ncbi:MAG: SpoIIE family protein phosphatase [Bacteroidales bacterium]|nr:SpoIIE family protein phosphatase [Bacteroidales bacterium]
MKRMRLSLASRVALYVAAGVALLYILSTAYIGRVTNRALMGQAKESAADMLEISCAKIEQVLKSTEAKTEAIAWVVRESIRDDAKLFKITQRFVEETPVITGSAIAIGDTLLRGREYFCPYSWRSDSGIHSKQLGTDDYNYFERDWFRPFYTLEPSWSEPYHDTDGGEKLMTTFSYPLTGLDGNALGVVTADVEIKLLSEIIDSLQLDSESQTILTTKSGTIVAADLATGSNADLVTIFDVADQLEDQGFQELSKALVEGKNGTTILGKKESDRVMVSYGTLSNGWSICVFYKFKEVAATTIKMRRFLFPFSLFSILLMSLLCGMIVKRLLKPLKKLTASAKEIAGGNFDTRLPEVTYNDEILELRDSFDNMQVSLKDYVENLKASTAANERYANELSIASKIQEAMLQQDFPDNSHIDIFARIIPAKQVGGDLYDFNIKDGKVYFAVGDVSGKGIPAALHMALTKSALRFVSGLVDTDHAVAKINNTLAENNPMDIFVTLFLACLDLETGKMTYCNAGHNPVVLVEPDGKARFLDQKPNLAGGLVYGFRYESQETYIAKGTKLVLYTDGVTEAENSAKELFGSERLLAWASEFGKDGSAKELAVSLLDTIKAYTGDIDQNDDITVMTMIYR